jgi:glyceraldehyde-3-phosphate dehydrogenase/erythrose-4-phosphate dehydrogenase
MKTPKKEVKAAIVGLGRVGSIFLKKAIERKDHGINIVAAAEKSQSAPGIQIAKDNGIRVYGDGKELVEMGDDIDIIFDLTGDPRVTMFLQRALFRSKNLHTVLAPEAFAHYVWSLMAADEEFPDHHMK